MSWKISGGINDAELEGKSNELIHPVYLTDMLDAVKKLASTGHTTIYIEKEEG
jgi:hypothetical protein